MALTLNRQLREEFFNFNHAYKTNHFTNQNECGTIGFMKTIHEIEETFKTESQCLDYLSLLRWPNGYRCPQCQYDEAWEVSDRKYKCKRCRHQTTVTAGTLFQDTHTPLPIWMKAAWLFANDEKGLSELELQKILEIGSNRTIHRMLSCFKYVKQNRKIDKVLLDGTIQIKFAPLTNRAITYKLAVAVEVKQRKIGFIQADLVDDERYTISDFISDNIVQNSVIKMDNAYLCNEWVRSHYCLNPGRMNQSTAYALRLFNSLDSNLMRVANLAEVKEVLRRRCQDNNRAKCPITFEDLVQGMVLLSPKERAVDRHHN